PRRWSGATRSSGPSGWRSPKSRATAGAEDRRLAMKRFSICMAIAVLAWMPSVVAADEIKDSWLTSKTKVRLLAEKRVKSTAVTVDTEDAVVTLRGKVRTSNERWAAEQVARQTDGVRGVNNLLQVVPEQHRKFVDSRDGSVKDSVRAKLDRDQILKDRSG